MHVKIAGRDTVIARDRGYHAVPAAQASASLDPDLVRGRGPGDRRPVACGRDSDGRDLAAVRDLDPAARDPCRAAVAA